MEEYEEEESGGYGWLWAVLGLAAAGGGAYWWYAIRPQQIAEAEKKKTEEAYQAKVATSLAAEPDPAKAGMAKLAADVDYPTVKYLDGHTERVSPEKKAELLASGKFKKGNATGTFLVEIDLATPATTPEKRGMTVSRKKGKA
jgi:hypothetical protein